MKTCDSWQLFGELKRETKGLIDAAQVQNFVINYVRKSINQAAESDSIGILSWIHKIPKVTTVGI